MGNDVKPAEPPKDRGKDLLILSLKQITGIFAASYVLLMLAAYGFLGPMGFRFTCILVMSLGLFCLRIFGEIAWVALRKPT